MKAKSVSVIAILAALLGGASLQAAEPEPLPVAKQGYLFAGGKYSTTNGKQVMSGQIYAEYQIPRARTHPYPIVMELDMKDTSAATPLSHACVGH